MKRIYLIGLILSLFLLYSCAPKYTTFYTLDYIKQDGTSDVINGYFYHSTKFNGYLYETYINDTVICINTPKGKTIICNIKCGDIKYNLTVKNHGKLKKKIK